jgi:thiamine-phosphate pyrophosphorylase
MLAPPRLYAIADGDFLGLEAVAEAVAELAEAGFAWIQLRLKKASDAERWRLAEASTRRLEGSAAALWIDDRVDLALLLPFFGIHLGQRDLPTASARDLLGAGKAIGLSTHDEEQCRAAEADPAADVVAAGPIFPTFSKANADPPLGLEGLRRLRGLTRKPLVAIGGIDGPRLMSVFEAGADTAVLLSALGRGREIGAKARRLLRLAA